LDDLMDETDQRVASLFTKKSHHRNISVMYIVQNLFHHRTISRNAHYMVLFQNLRDASQIMVFLWCVYEYTVSSFVNIIYHCRAFSSAERPCYSLSVWCKSDKKRVHHFGRSHGRNGSKGGFTVYEKESPQKHQRHVHRSESVSP
jgi:hypothetical protein